MATRYEKELQAAADEKNAQRQACPVASALSEALWAAISTERALDRAWLDRAESAAIAVGAALARRQEVSGDEARAILSSLSLPLAAPDSGAHAPATVNPAQGATEPQAVAPARLGLLDEDEDESEEFARDCRETAAKANAQPEDVSKRVVVIDGREVTLYRMWLADGAEHWVSTQLAESGISAYRVAVTDGEGRAVIIGRISARCLRHAENRARVMFGGAAKVLR